MIEHATRFRLQLALSLLLLVLAILTTVHQGQAEDSKPIEVSYEGRLQDGSQKPIAGIFPLEFRLYQSAEGKAPIWKESKDRPIRGAIVKPGDEVFLSVNLQDGGELTREPLVIPSDPKAAKEAAPGQDNKAPDEGPVVAQQKQDQAPGSPSAPKGQYKTESSFAELADFAKRAEVAENAQKLGGKTLGELEEEMDRLSTRINELRKAQGEGGGAEGAAMRLGASTEILQRAGGTGGGPYVRECPPNHVVTGIRGTAGALIDSIQLICTPLELR